MRALFFYFQFIVNFLVNYGSFKYLKIDIFLDFDLPKQWFRIY